MNSDHYSFPPSSTLFSSPSSVSSSSPSAISFPASSSPRYPSRAPVKVKMMVEKDLSFIRHARIARSSNSSNNHGSRGKRGSTSKYPRDNSKFSAHFNHSSTINNHNEEPKQVHDDNQWNSCTTTATTTPLLSSPIAAVGDGLLTCMYPSDQDVYDNPSMDNTTQHPYYQDNLDFNDANASRATLITPVASESPFKSPHFTRRTTGLMASPSTRTNISNSEASHTSFRFRPSSEFIKPTNTVVSPTFQEGYPTSLDSRLAHGPNRSLGLQVDSMSPLTKRTFMFTQRHQDRTTSQRENIWQTQTRKRASVHQTPHFLQTQEPNRPSTLSSWVNGHESPTLWSPVTSDTQLGSPFQRPLDIVSPQFPQHPAVELDDENALPHVFVEPAPLPSSYATAAPPAGSKGETDQFEAFVWPEDVEVDTDDTCLKKEVGDDTSSSIAGDENPSRLYWDKIRSLIEERNMEAAVFTERTGNNVNENVVEDETEHYSAAPRRRTSPLSSTTSPSSSPPTSVTPSSAMPITTNNTASTTSTRTRASSRSRKSGSSQKLKCVQDHPSRNVGSDGNDVQCMRIETDSSSDGENVDGAGGDGGSSETNRPASMQSSAETILLLD